MNRTVDRQIHAVNRMNVQGRPTMRGMQEMEWDRQRRDSGMMHRDGGKPQCSWKVRRGEAGEQRLPSDGGMRQGQLQGTTRGESRA